MHTSTIVRDLIIFLVAAIVIGYLIFRLIRRGISKKYDRTSPVTAKSTWNALSDGEDPTA
jgi:uncharacterized membrane-anchored protein YhcB (DUF1043 family)